MENIQPALVFLSEPSIFNCDLLSVSQFFPPNISFHLNSEDMFDEALPLERSRAKGGTMALWPSSLDPYISILPTTTPAILPCRLRMPGLMETFHFCIYFPTAGQEEIFVETLAALSVFLEDIYENGDGETPVFIRGDANASSKNVSRSRIFNHFIARHNLHRLAINHNTYHHFIGTGQFDSDLDVILFTNTPGQSESLHEIICKHKNPLIDSHHDLIITSCTIPLAPAPITNSHIKTIAPKIQNSRQKVLWSEEGVVAYSAAVSGALEDLQERWEDSLSSPASMSALLSSTYTLLKTTAAATNKVINLGESRPVKFLKSPVISRLRNIVLAAHRHLVSITSTASSTVEEVGRARAALTLARGELQRATRAQLHRENLKRDQLLASMDFPSLYRSIKSSKTAKSSKISSIRVNDLKYEGDSVPDGFFHSMKDLKHPDMSLIHNTPHFQATLFDYDNIIKICRDKSQIPPITAQQSADILFGVRASVNDFYSVTAKHFINAGPAGIAHHHFLLSALISNVNLCGIEELNNAWACILYKGHQKDRESDRSYRTISTCPFLAKCADVYVGRLYNPGWSACQAETQFQGEGSSHELSALLLTETIQHSIYVNKKPVFALMLDAKSAFDKIVRQCAIRSAYLAGSQDQGLLYLDSRLAARKTYPEWDRTLMGPIEDLLGLEQGNVNSDKIYKLCNNNQLTTAQLSGQGVDCNAATVSAIGQADDTVLVSDCIVKLAGLVHLAAEYCAAFHVTLVPEKTKLLAFSSTSKSSQQSVKYAKLINPIYISSLKIPFSNSAEHVGVLRSPGEGNMPHILARVAAHRRAIHAVLQCGMARAHRGSPVAGLQLERTYGAPVLLSGCAALVLTTGETSILHQHYTSTVRQLLRVSRHAPECFTMFMAGTLPATAVLHLRMLGLLGMIARLGPSCILGKLGRQALLAADNPKSWFLVVRLLTQQYGLQDPLLVLQAPDTRRRWKATCKARVTRWWQVHYCGQATNLLSLRHFNPHFFYLTKPHHTISTATTPHQVVRATTVVAMLSGRYVTDYRTRHWDRANPEGRCRLCPATPLQPAPLGTLEHQLVWCPALQGVRTRLLEMWSAYTTGRPHLLQLVEHYTSGCVQDFMTFVLNPSSCHLIIINSRSHPSLIHDSHYMSRMWCHFIHVKKLKLLKSRGLV